MVRWPAYKAGGGGGGGGERGAVIFQCLYRVAEWR